jgi:hypothetical protein
MSKELRATCQRMCAWLVAVALALAVLYGAGWLVWQMMLEVPPTWARGWALATTALLPIVAWTGWYFGHTESRGRLAGIDQAVDRVIGAATKTAGLRVGTARAMRQVTRPDPPVTTVILPDVEIIPRRQLSGGNVIEL